MGRFKQRSSSPRISYEDIPDIIYLQYPWYSEAARVHKVWQRQWTWSFVLNESAFEFALTLTSLFKQSFDKGALPSAWRDANITAIFKKGYSVDFKNYRPVSLTSLIAKTMEHFICKQIRSHLSRNSVISSTRMTSKKDSRVRPSLLRSFTSGRVVFLTSVVRSTWSSLIS